MSHFEEALEMFWLFSGTAQAEYALNPRKQFLSTRATPVVGFCSQRLGNAEAVSGVVSIRFGPGSYHPGRAYFRTETPQVSPAHELTAHSVFFTSGAIRGFFQVLMANFGLEIIAVNKMRGHGCTYIHTDLMVWKRVPTC